MIKASFDELESKNPADKERYESLAKGDMDRFQKEEREQADILEKHRVELKKYLDEQIQIQKQITQKPSLDRIKDEGDQMGKVAPWLPGNTYGNCENIPLPGINDNSEYKDIFGHPLTN